MLEVVIHSLGRSDAPGPRLWIVNAVVGTAEVMKNPPISVGWVEMELVRVPPVINSFLCQPSHALIVQPVTSLYFKL